MSVRRSASVFVSVAISIATLFGSNVALGTTPLNLGPKPSFGLFQPRVTVDISTVEGQSFGPTNNTFLLDTAANGIVIFPPATDQLTGSGFVNEGTYEEFGITGASEFQVSAPYQLTYLGNDDVGQVLDDVRFMSGARPVDPTGLMGLDGIIGMAGMIGKVTTLDNLTRANAPSLSMGVTFSDRLPTTTTHRLSIPFTKTVFEVEDQGGPEPTWSEALPTVTLNSSHNGTDYSTPIVFDTGAQLTIISEDDGELARPGHERKRRLLGRSHFDGFRSVERRARLMHPCW